MAINAWTGFTNDGSYVPYISVNPEGESKSLVKISVRASGNTEVTEIIMHKNEYALFLIEGMRNL